MKKLMIFMGVFTGIIILLILTNVCSCDNKKNTESASKKHLNISVFLDLSDRLKDENSGMKQCDKDTAIVNNIVDLFVKNVVDNKIIKRNDCFKVFFYPQPNNSKINLLASKLEYDLAKVPIGEKKMKLNQMKKVVNESLSEIYSCTIRENKWPGCDIWGFFKDKVKPLCIKDGYRNILIILTDGYIYHEESKITDGNKTSFILPSVLNGTNPQLICKTKDLGDLEVLFLEIDNNSSYNDKLKTIIGNWLGEMGVSKYEIHGTDAPANTKVIIENFIK